MFPFLQHKKTKKETNRHDKVEQNKTNCHLTENMKHMHVKLYNDPDLKKLGVLDRVYLIYSRSRQETMPFYKAGRGK